MKSISAQFLLLLTFFMFTFLQNVTANNITDYQTIVHKILNAAQTNEQGYQRLSHMCNEFGSRLSGSQSLEDAIDWVVSTMKAEDGFDSVQTENVFVPTWVRNDGYIKMTFPRNKNLDMLALGGSVSTSSPITAEVLVVTSFDDLKEKSEEAKGKIIVYNTAFTTYSATATYRKNGAIEAAKVGAIASIVRSVTPYSLYTPHTGSVYYEEGVTKIPAAAITVEDSILLQSLQNAGITPILTMYMNPETLSDSLSRNIIAEIKGTVLPDEYVVIGGHIDSWDVGAGAHDDAGGCLQAWEAINILLSLNLRPRRTIRVVMWTNEENGFAGANTYFDDNLDIINSTVFCMESDSGTFRPSGFSFAGTAEAMIEVRKLAELFYPTLEISVTAGSAGADVSPLTNAGVPGAGLSVTGDHGLYEYFWYHHTNADTIDHVDIEHYRLCTAVMAAVAYVTADMADNLPRTSYYYY